MIYTTIALLIVTILATYWARDLALHRRRHVGAWALATAMLPPVVLILWALPPKSVAATS